MVLCWLPDSLFAHSWLVSLVIMVWSRLVSWPQMAQIIWFFIGSSALVAGLSTDLLCVLCPQLGFHIMFIGNYDLSLLVAWPRGGPNNTVLIHNDCL